MVFILFRDGTHLEVQRCQDVIHKLGLLFCIDALEAPLLCLPAEAVLAYTRNAAVAASFLQDTVGAS